MRGLLSLISALCLFASLATGAVVHAAELVAAGEVTAATQWLHADGDHDQVPADADKDYPHHHNVCHGHDLAAPVKTCGGPGALDRAGRPAVAADALPAAGPPDSPLRPPIA